LTLTLTGSHLANTSTMFFACSRCRLALVGHDAGMEQLAAGNGARGAGAGSPQLQSIQDSSSTRSRSGDEWFQHVFDSGQSMHLSGLNPHRQCSRSGQRYRSFGQSRKFGVWNAYNKQRIFCRRGTQVRDGLQHGDDPRFEWEFRECFDRVYRPCERMRQISRFAHHSRANASVSNSQPMRIGIGMKFHHNVYRRHRDIGLFWSVGSVFRYPYRRWQKHSAAGLASIRSHHSIRYTNGNCGFDGTNTGMLLTGSGMVDMNRSFIIASVALVLATPSSYAQKTKTQLQTEITNNFPITRWGRFTPAIARQHSLILSFLAAIHGVNAPTGTSYTIQTSDYGNSSVNNANPVAVTLPNPGTGFQRSMLVRNLGAGLVTITPIGSNMQCGSDLGARQKSISVDHLDGVNYQTGSFCCTRIVLESSGRSFPVFNGVSFQCSTEPLSLATQRRAADDHPTPLTPTRAADQSERAGQRIAGRRMF